MCGGEAELGGKGMDRWAGACTNADCQTEGPMRKGREAAAAAWNRRASPWRTMETAPRDGRFLITNAIKEVCACQSKDGARIVQNMPGYAEWSWPEPATHWHPLPEPPEGV
jgi:hypothetical protein